LLTVAPAELLRELIRFDTSNPPGNERACIEHVATLLREAGIDFQTYGARPERPNLVARLAGSGRRPGLVLQGHVDVVTTANQRWTYPPFQAHIAEGFIWGRGALDMKNGVAMMVSAFLRAKRENIPLPGEVILCLLVDEEAGGVEGAEWLVANQPDLFQGVRYTIGEGGGYSFMAGGRRFYSVMVSEKRGCQLKVTLRGPGGHGSLPMRGGAMAKLGQLLVKLDSARLPVHLTPPVRLMLEAMRDSLGGELGERYGGLLDPARADSLLDRMGADGRSFDAILHNTVNATIVEGGLKINVIPSAVAVELDGRLLPGFGPEDLISEVRALIGEEAEIEVVRLGPAQPELDLSGLEVLSQILRELDPEGIPVPYLVSGATDGRHFAELGIRTYGFTPVRLPDGFDAWSTIHDADERIPVDGLDLGTEAIYQAILRL